MANAITDNRTLVDDADADTPYDDLAGVSGGNIDAPPQIFIQGTASIGEIISSTVNGILFDAGSAQDWSNNVFYIWINCGIVGLLDTKANAGFTIRFCGATVSDWFEVYVGGNDSWPVAVAGGWVQFVVDIELARAAAIIGTVGGTNGGVPLTSAIRYVGWSGITTSVMTKMVDNTWIDEIRRLPFGEPGIIISGENQNDSPFRPWNVQDIFDELGQGTGTFKEAVGGSFAVNTPIQIGTLDESPSTETHRFADINKIILWENQEFVGEDFYKIVVQGDELTSTDVNMGVKSGSGDDAVGSQGLVISAAETGVRWGIEASSNLFRDLGPFIFDEEDMDASPKVADTTQIMNVNFHGILIQPTEDGELAYITAMMRAIGGGSSIRFGIYEETGGSPEWTLIGETNVVGFFESSPLAANIMVRGYFEAAASPLPHLTAGTDYIVGVYADDINVTAQLMVRSHGDPQNPAGSPNFGRQIDLGSPQEGFLPATRGDTDVSIPPPIASFEFEYMVFATYKVPSENNGANFYGCQFIHGDVFDLDDPAVEVISTSYIDCTSARVDKSLQLKNAVIAPNTASGEAFMRTNDFGDIVRSQFFFGAAGHAVEIDFGTDDEPGGENQTSKGNIFTGFGDISPVTTQGNPTPETGSLDAALFHNREFGSPQELVVSITDGGDSPTVRNGRLDITDIQNNVAITIVGAQEGTEIAICLTGTQIAVDGIENVASPTDFTFTVAAGTAVDIILHALAFEYLKIVNFVALVDATIPVSQRVDRNYENPEN